MKLSVLSIDVYCPDSLLRDTIEERYRCMRTDLALLK